MPVSRSSGHPEIGDTPIHEEEEEHPMETKRIKVDTGMGLIWFAGWLFTIAYAKLIWWQAILGLVVWPYYIGLAVR
jgi:hypothetical protein